MAREGSAEDCNGGYRCNMPPETPPDATLENQMPELPFQRHSDTSRDAADKALGGAESQRRRVYQLIKKAGAQGVTDIEAQELLDMNPSTQRPRRIELVRKGLVYDSGERRLTPSGRKAVVWVAR